MKHEPNSLYAIYKRRHEELLGIARDQSNIVSTLGMDDTQSDGTKQGEILSGLIERLQSETLRVLVIGRFSAGKSTFVNALFGQALLPASPTPTTGVLCKVKFAEEDDKRAVLYPKEGMGADKSSDPFDVSVSSLQDELRRYVRIDHSGETQETSRFRRLELYWPLDLCANGVEIVDSVGLDDPEARDAITMQYANSADVILYCMSGVQAYTARDKSVLTLLRSMGHESIFFVITYYDHIRQSIDLGETTEQRFQEEIYGQLTDWTEMGRDGIKFVDSKSALLGRVKGNLEDVEDSGIRDVEDELESFLVQQKGNAKLVTSLRALRTVNREVRRVIPNRIQMLDTSIEDLERRYAEAELPLRNLESKKQLIVGRVNSEITDIARDTYDAADGYFSELADKIGTWATEYEIEGSVGFPPRKSTIEPVVREVIDHLKTCIECDIAEWNRTSLSPMIETRIELMQDTLESEAKEFVKSVDEVRVQISVGQDIVDDEIAANDEPSVFGRLVGVGYAAVTGDFVTGGLGAVLGPKAMLKTIICQVVAGVLLGILGLLNPVAILIAAISATVAGSFLNLLSLKNGIKKTVAEKLADSINERRSEFARKVESEVKTKLKELSSALDAGLAAEISRVKGEVEKVLRERKQGQLDATTEIKKLQRISDANSELEEKLDALLYEAGITPQPV